MITVMSSEEINTNSLDELIRRERQLTNRKTEIKKRKYFDKTRRNS
jgi:hypothetical protein